MPLRKKTQFTTHPSTDRERKNLLFLNLIKRQKSTSRTEMSKLTDINIVTVSNYINNYLKKDLVLERGYDISSGGRRPELIDLNREWGYVVGIDIGEDQIKGMLADLDMKVLANGAINGYEKNNSRSFIDEMLKKLLESSKIDKTRVKKIGIGVSAVSDDIIREVIKVKDAIEDRINIPILVGDGALCAAFGEKSLNPDAEQATRTLYIYRDIGQGVFIKNNEFYEASSQEDKYAYLKPWGERLDIVNEAKRIVERGIGTALIDIAGGNVENITTETVIKAAKEQDEVAVDLVKTAGMNLGVRIAYLINSFEPEVVIIGGGIEEAGDLFLKSLKASINRFILQRMSDEVKLTLAILGREACVKGGASLAIREAFLEA